ncbi:hypothetical protein [Actinomadura sp. NBRC 104412]|uniref:hypothetical protein n=1 Tax=Actinomadura sp. NBRC 104412 TaxID=3032203 RepID=UPI002554280C|nr:hypothetical protein [Actinomadura sp. NBRC 104412]
MTLLLGGCDSLRSSYSVCRDGTCRVVVSKPGETIEVKNHRLTVIKYHSDGLFIQVDGSPTVILPDQSTTRVGAITITVISIEDVGDVIFDVT